MEVDFHGSKIQASMEDLLNLAHHASEIAPEGDSNMRVRVNLLGLSNDASPVGRFVYGQILLQSGDQAERLKGSKLIELAAADGHLGAVQFAVEHLLKDPSEQRRVRKAIELLTDFCDTEIPAILGLLAQIYRSPKYGTYDPEKAFQLSRRAAATGDAKSLTNLALCYLEGIGTPVNSEAGIHYLREAEAKGDNLALVNLAREFQRGIHVERNGTEAVRLLKIAVANGYIGAHYDLGCTYAGGYAITPDPAKGAFHFGVGADLGHPPSQRELGTLFLRGIGVASDPQKAFALFMRAAQAGDPQAMHNVGFCFLAGTGVEPDRSKAREWTENAARAGHEEAQFLLEDWENVQPDCS